VYGSSHARRKMRMTMRRKVAVTRSVVLWAKPLTLFVYFFISPFLSQVTPAL
jgi:hypothetical protein